MDVIEEAIGRLRGAPELHVVDAAALLLGVCRAMERQLAAQLDVRPSLYESHVRASRGIVPPASKVTEPEFLEATILSGAADFIEAGGTGEDKLLRVRAMATALDMQRSGQFFFRYRGRRTLLQPGDPVPIGPDVISEELGTTRGISTPPDDRDYARDLGVPYDGLERLRLCPMDVGPFALYFDASYAETIDALFDAAVPGPTTLWAAVIPTCQLLTDLDYTPIDSEAECQFFDVRPKIPANFSQRTLALLDAAVAKGARIIVLPELCLDEQVEKDVHAWFRTQPTVAILVAGSRHMTADDKPRNRATILLKGCYAESPTIVLEHDKFSEFWIKLDKERSEAIHRIREISIYAGSRWSLTAFICKDFMSDVARRLVGDLRVRAVFVPSMSPKTDQFVVEATAMAQNTHALVFFAIAPHGEDDYTAIFATPLREPAAVSKVQRGTGLVLISQTNPNEFHILYP